MHQRRKNILKHECKIVDYREIWECIKGQNIRMSSQCSAETSQICIVLLVKCRD